PVGRQIIETPLVEQGTADGEEVAEDPGSVRRCGTGLGDGFDGIGAFGDLREEVELDRRLERGAAPKRPQIREDAIRHRLSGRDHEILLRLASPVSTALTGICDSFSRNYGRSNRRATHGRGRRYRQTVCQGHSSRWKRRGPRRSGRRTGRYVAWLQNPRHDHWPRLSFASRSFAALPTG